MNRQAVFCLLMALLGPLRAQVTVPQAATLVQSQGGQQTVEQWLMRMHGAARQSAYVGTFVVTTGSAMSSARIWHVCEGSQQLERVEALTGVPRATYRRNDQVVTYLPQSRVVIVEKRASLGLFSSLLSRADSSIAQHYQLKSIGRDRVAGYMSDVVQLIPRDNWRYGYKVWTERSTGLVVKLQTLNAMQAVLEQAAFSDLQLAQPISWAKLSAMMDNTGGFIVKKPELIETTPDLEGWSLNATVPGFKSIGCHRRQDGVMASAKGPLQWVFSDGLASVSLFFEAFDPARHGKLQHHDQFSMGATHMHTRQIGAWWVTAVGEVPQETLQIFAQGLERKK